MNIVEGHFYFVEDSFFAFVADPFLMSNKESGIKRPCFMAIDQGDGIIWMVPVTSKIAKFRSIYAKKMDSQGKCDTLVFGSLLGRDCVFLIQNIFPIIPEFLSCEYIQASNSTPVSVSGPVVSNIKSKAKKVLAMVKHGKRGLVFPNILDIERRLRERLVLNKPHR